MWFDMTDRVLLIERDGALAGCCNDVAVHESSGTHSFIDAGTI
jgi:hypothetical protein